MVNHASVERSVPRQCVSYFKLYRYNADLFLEEISEVLQSNDTSMSDDELEFVTVQNRSGGKRKSINKIPYDKILSEKTRFLYNPDNARNHLCIH